MRGRRIGCVPVALVLVCGWMMLMMMLDQCEGWRMVENGLSSEIRRRRSSMMRMTMAAEEEGERRYDGGIELDKVSR